jgi:predicted permease
VEASLNTVLPVFGLIVLGLVFARRKLVDETAARGITQFVFNLAIPALLFRTVSAMESTSVAPWVLWIPFFGGIAVTWIAATTIARFNPAIAAGGGAAAAMTAGFGNLALLGTPLALAHFGDKAAVPAGLILSIHAPVLWFAATLQRELSRHAGNFSFARMLRELLANLARNAIILALLFGALWRQTGLGIHPILSAMLDMLADASVPTALFALGLSLAGYSLRGQTTAMVLLIALKMLLLPLAVFLLLLAFPGLPPLWGHVALLFAAMPTGANAFLFASRHEEAVAPVSAAASASILLTLIDRNLI